MEIHYFDKSSGKYTHSAIADESPLEPGEFLVPVNAIPAALPALNPHESAVINATRDGWDVVADYIGTEYWLADGSHHRINELGVSPPVVALNEAPFIVADAKQSAITRLKLECRTHIIGGINIGVLHYPTTRDDQADINGLHAGAKELGAAGEPYKFMCADTQGVWARRDHTAAQITDVALAVLQHVRLAKNKLDDKLVEVDAAEALPTPTQADFDAIVWN